MRALIQTRFWPVAYLDVAVAVVAMAVFFVGAYFILGSRAPKGNAGA